MWKKKNAFAFINVITDLIIIIAAGRLLGVTVVVTYINACVGNLVQKSNVPRRHNAWTL